MAAYDIRWQQRFDNYQKIFALLRDALLMPTPDIVQKAGIIQFFEITFELSWKLMKDYLESKGFQSVNSPREAIRKAYEVGLIADGHIWIKLLESRNITTHVYNVQEITLIEDDLAAKYFPLFEALHETFAAISSRTHDD